MRAHVSESSTDRLKQAITDAGLEVYRVEGDDILLAERVRMHLMESGVVVRTAPQLCIMVRVRAQRSDFPAASEDALYDTVRGAMDAAASANGFAETATEARQILHPSDDSQVLDVWYEVTYGRELPEAELIDAARWAIAQPRCIDRSR